MLHQRIISTGSTSSTSSNGNKTNKKRPPVFPKRLYDMLENAERDGYAHVISWMPDGKSFKIHVDGSLDEEDGKAIVEILKRTFNQTRFKSFLRQLQLYNFERTYRGPHRGECRHELFVRGRRDLLHKKAIEDFQRKEINESPKRVRTIFQSARPEEVTSFMQKNDPTNCNTCAFSSSKPFVRVVSTGSSGSGCPYLQTSTIPTKLINLILPYSDSSACNDIDDDDDELSLTKTCPLTNKNMQTVVVEEYDDDLISIHSGDNVPCLTGMELKILQHAL